MFPRSISTASGLSLNQTTSPGGKVSRHVCSKAWLGLSLSCSVSGVHAVPVCQRTMMQLSPHGKRILCFLSVPCSASHGQPYVIWPLERPLVPHRRQVVAVLNPTCRHAFRETINQKRCTIFLVVTTLLQNTSPSSVPSGTAQSMHLRMVSVSF